MGSMVDAMTAKVGTTLLWQKQTWSGSHVIRGGVRSGPKCVLGHAFGMEPLRVEDGRQQCCNDPCTLLSSCQMPLPAPI